MILRGDVKHPPGIYSTATPHTRLWFNGARQVHTNKYKLTNQCKQNVPKDDRARQYG